MGIIQESMKELVSKKEMQATLKYVKALPQKQRLVRSYDISERTNKAMVYLLATCRSIIFAGGVFNRNISDFTELLYNVDNRELELFMPGNHDKTLERALEALTKAQEVVRGKSQVVRPQEEQLQDKHAELVTQELRAIKALVRQLCKAVVEIRSEVHLIKASSASTQASTDKTRNAINEVTKAIKDIVVREDPPGSREADQAARIQPH